MDIIHERPSQRLHYRVTAPMRVTFRDQSFAAADWGLGGCRISGLTSPMPETGSQHTLICTLPFQGFNISLKAEATVVRLDTSTGDVAFRFTQLGERETALMQHFVEDLVRGAMTDVADTIVRIDTPVTPVPTKPDPNPIQQMPVRRWPVKQICMTLFYLTLGLVVFGYVGVYVFATLFRLEVDAAVVTAFRTQITAPVAVRILETPVRAGEETPAGTLLAVIEDTSHEAELRRAQSALATIRAELIESETLRAEERRRADGYALVARNNVRQASSQLDGLALARRNAELKVQRLRALGRKGLVLPQDVEAAELSLKSVISELERKQIHVEELNELIDGGDSIRLFTGNAFAGQLAELDAKIARLSAEEAFQATLVADLEQKNAWQIIDAPFDGRVVEASVVPGTALKQGEPILTLEETGAETVSAFLTQDEVAQIRVGSVADLYLPTENKWIEADVVQIDRTDGFVDEITETHRFRAPEARSAKVTLRPRTSSLPTAGTPVTVYFERHRNNRVWRTVSRLVGGVS